MNRLITNEIVQKLAKLCGHRRTVALLPYDIEFFCVACGYNFLRRKQQDSSKTSRNIYRFYQ